MNLVARVNIFQKQRFHRAPRLPDYVSRMLRVRSHAQQLRGEVDFRVIKTNPRRDVDEVRPGAE